MDKEIKQLLLDIDSVLSYLWYRGFIDKEKIINSNLVNIYEVEDLLTRVRRTVDAF